MAFSTLLRGVIAAACTTSAVALRLSAPGASFGSASAASAVSCVTPQMALPARPAQTRLAHLRMQQLDDSSRTFYDEYVETDPVTGESKALSLDEKEKLYLECLDMFYNEEGKEILSNEEYDQLKLDLEFDGSRVATFSADEIKFVLSNKRYKMGKPILSDADYDELRSRLKSAGSTVVIHDSAKCSLEDGICKTDLFVDQGKTRLLYLPGTIGGSLLLSELFFWTIHIDPILSIILGAVPSYFFGVWFTENVFAQKPLVTQSSCPNCNSVNTVFFGDLFSVQTDGIVGEPTPPGDSIDFVCSNCKEPLTASRQTMLVQTKNPKVVS